MAMDWAAGRGVFFMRRCCRARPHRPRRASARPRRRCRPGGWTFPHASTRSTESAKSFVILVSKCSSRRSCSRYMPDPAARTGHGDPGRDPAGPGRSGAGTEQAIRRAIEAGIPRTRKEPRSEPAAGPRPGPGNSPRAQGRRVTGSCCRRRRIHTGHLTRAPCGRRPTPAEYAPNEYASLSVSHPNSVVRFGTHLYASLIARRDIPLPPATTISGGGSPAQTAPATPARHCSTGIPTPSARATQRQPPRSRAGLKTHHPWRQ